MGKETKTGHDSEQSYDVQNELLIKEMFQGDFSDLQEELSLNEDIEEVRDKLKEVQFTGKFSEVKETIEKEMKESKSAASFAKTFNKVFTKLEAELLASGILAFKNGKEKKAIIKQALFYHPDVEAIYLQGYLFMPFKEYLQNTEIVRNEIMQGGIDETMTAEEIEKRNSTLFGIKRNKEIKMFAERYKALQDSLKKEGVSLEKTTSFEKLKSIIQVWISDGYLLNTQRGIGDRLDELEEAGIPLDVFELAGVKSPADIPSSLLNGKGGKIVDQAAYIAWINDTSGNMKLPEASVTVKQLQNPVRQYLKGVPSTTESQLQVQTEPENPEVIQQGKTKLILSDGTEVPIKLPPDQLPTAPGTLIMIDKKTGNVTITPPAKPTVVVPQGDPKTTDPNVLDEKPVHPSEAPQQEVSTQKKHEAEELISALTKIPDPSRFKELSEDMDTLIGEYTFPKPGRSVEQSKQDIESYLATKSWKKVMIMYADGTYGSTEVGKRGAVELYNFVLQQNVVTASQDVGLLWIDTSTPQGRVLKNELVGDAAFAVGGDLYEVATNGSGKVRKIPFRYTEEGATYKEYTDIGYNGLVGVKSAYDKLRTGNYTDLRDINIDTITPKADRVMKAEIPAQYEAALDTIEVGEYGIVVAELSGSTTNVSINSELNKYAAELERRYPGTVKVIRVPIADDPSYRPDRGTAEYYFTKHAGLPARDAANSDNFPLIWAVGRNAAGKLVYSPRFTTVNAAVRQVIQSIES